MKNRLLVYFGLLALLFSACSPKIITLPGKTEYIVKDSLITKIDTLKIPIPVESHSTIAADSSHLETSLAISDAWVDSTGLRHTLKNKKTTISAPVTSTEHVIYRDSIVFKPYPVEVEKEVIKIPLFHKIFSVIGLLALFASALWAVFTIKPRL